MKTTMHSSVVKTDFRLLPYIENYFFVAFLSFQVWKLSETFSNEIGILSMNISDISCITVDKIIPSAPH